MIVGITLIATLAFGVSLQWDENPDSNCAGYRLYYGTRSREYTNSIDTGTNRTVSVPVQIGTKYFFAVTAYNSDGLEGDFSEELLYTPVILRLVIESSPDLRSWVALTNFEVLASEEQRFFRIRVP